MKNFNEHNYLIVLIADVNYWFDWCEWAEGNPKYFRPIYCFLDLISSN